MESPLRRGSRGTSLSELLVGVALMALSALIATPAISSLARQMTLQAAAREVAQVFMMARSHAAQQRRDTGIRWVAVAGDIEFTVYEDRNGNGVLTADIRSGIDRPILGPLAMKKRHTRVSFSYVPGFHGPDPSGVPVVTTQPIRFGRSSICTFSPIGDASPGTVYLSDETGRQSCVRVSPGSGRIQILDWDGGARKWQRRL